MLACREIKLADANAFVIAHHRHHDAVVGHKWSLGAYDDAKLVGVAIVGRPSGRYLDDGHSLEVTRLATDGTRNACSFLYAAAARRASAEGYDRIITYILQSESGVSLKAAGWHVEAEKCGRPAWNKQRYANRPEQLCLFAKKIPPKEYKQRWSKILRRSKK